MRFSVTLVFLCMHMNPSFAEESICNLVTEKRISISVSSFARKELLERKIEISSDVSRDLVEDCRDFYIFSQSIDLNMLGGIVYVIISKSGLVMYVHRVG